MTPHPDDSEVEDPLISRATSDQSPPRICSRTTWACTLSILSALSIAVAYAIAGDSGQWGSRRYAEALSSSDELREGCDAGLRLRKLWHLPPISHALCVPDAATPALPPAVPNELRFVVLGDWGRDGMCCQRDVALRISEVASTWAPHFLINVGDNFYPAGIRAPDDPQIASSWADVYASLPSMRTLPWLTVAGNHDHMGDVHAQLKLSKSARTWHMPSLSYFEERGDVLFAFIDTTPMYYSPLELTLFPRNFSATDVSTQLRTLDEKLAASKARVKIVVGHHPLFSIGHHFTDEIFNLARMQGHLKKLLERHRVIAYFCGHEHSLEHGVSNGVHYFISGAGSKVRRVDSHTPENVFGIGRQGFMATSVRNDSMSVFVVDMAGVVLHSVNITVPV